MASKREEERTEPWVMSIMGFLWFFFNTGYPSSYILYIVQGILKSLFPFLYACVSMNFTHFFYMLSMIRLFFVLFLKGRKKEYNDFSQKSFSYRGFKVS